MLNLTLSLTLALWLFPSPTHPSHSLVFRICSFSSVCFLHSIFSVSWLVICSLLLPSSILHHPFSPFLFAPSHLFPIFHSSLQYPKSHFTLLLFILFSSLSLSPFLHPIFFFFFPHTTQIVAWPGLLMSPLLVFPLNCFYSFSLALSQAVANAIKGWQYS